MATAASIQGRIAFGPNAGKKVIRLGGSFGYAEEAPLFKGKLCYAMNGFTIHAARSINTLDRKGLEQLISYIARGPFSNDRLTLVPGRKVNLRLKRPFSDGSTFVQFTYEEFLEKVSALIPPPKSHLVRWSGSLAPNSKYRPKIIRNPEEKKGFDFPDEPELSGKPNYSWAEVLSRVFGIEVLKCDCGGVFKPMGAIKDEEQAWRFLKHVGLDHTPPARAPPHGSVHMVTFDQIIEGFGEEPVIYTD